MIPAVSQFKLNHVDVGFNYSPNPIPMLPTLHRRRCCVFRVPVRSYSSTDFKITAHVETDSTVHLERCFNAPVASELPSISMKGGHYGAFGAVTLEKSKLDMSQMQTRSSRELDIGGGGGGIGKKINHGGGDGGDDDGDDDYFDDFDDGDEGDEGGLFRRRILFEELFDRKFVDAVLNEWQKTMMDLPAGLRQAYEMGLVSVRIFSRQAYRLSLQVIKFIKFVSTGI